MSKTGITGFRKPHRSREVAPHLSERARMFSADTCRRLLVKLTHLAQLVVAEQDRTAEPGSFDDEMMVWLSSLEHDEFRAWDWLDLKQGSLRKTENKAR